MKRFTKRFWVWAPYAKKISLKLSDQLLPMQAQEKEYFFCEAEVSHGDEYSFFFKGRVLPDPRSCWQPKGVHGPSCVVDHTQFCWTDKNFVSPPLSHAIFYEIHVGTFTKEATFQSIISKLDHLIQLGVTHIELMPVAEFSGSRGWGYDGVDLFAPHHAYGGPQGLKELVNACHNKGIAVILDVVYNHLGPEGNYLAHFGPYFSKTKKTPWGRAINFDGPNATEVRRFFCDNALMWLQKYHIDGLRLDAVQSIIDSSETHFLSQLSKEVSILGKKRRQRFVLLAESDQNEPKLLRTRSKGGFGLDAQWNDNFHHALHALLTGERDGYYQNFGKISDLLLAFQTPFPKSLTQTKQTALHTEEFSQDRFLTYLQNHDQVGNRAVGERINHLLSKDLLKIASALFLFAPQIPMLFQGEEWAASTPFYYFTNHKSQKLARAVRLGRLREFASFTSFKNTKEIPDPQSKKTFLVSTLNWEELQKRQHQNIFEWYQCLIQIRKQFLCISKSKPNEIKSCFSEKERWFCLLRQNLLLICNLDSQSKVLHKNVLENSKGGKEVSSAFLEILSQEKSVLLSNATLFKVGAKSVTIPSDSVALLTSKLS